jgi:hypothetical protein
MPEDCGWRFEVLAFSVMCFVALFTVVSSRLGEGWAEMRLAFLPKGCFFLL